MCEKLWKIEKKKILIHQHWLPLDFEWEKKEKKMENADTRRKSEKHKKMTSLWQFSTLNILWQHIIYFPTLNIWLENHRSFFFFLRSSLKFRERNSILQRQERRETSKTVKQTRMRPWREFLTVDWGIHRHDEHGNTIMIWNIVQKCTKIRRNYFSPQHKFPFYQIIQIMDTFDVTQLSSIGYTAANNHRRAEECHEKLLRSCHCDFK